MCVDVCTYVCIHICIYCMYLIYIATHVIIQRYTLEQVPWGKVQKDISIIQTYFKVNKK